MFNWSLERPFNKKVCVSLPLNTQSLRRPEHKSLHCYLLQQLVRLRQHKKMCGHVSIHTTSLC